MEALKLLMILGVVTFLGSNFVQAEEASSTYQMPDAGAGRMEAPDSTPISYGPLPIMPDGGVRVSTSEDGKSITVNFPDDSGVIMEPIKEGRGGINIIVPNPDRGGTAVKHIPLPDDGRITVNETDADGKVIRQTVITKDGVTVYE